MTWYIVYTCISYSIYTHSPVGKRRTFVVAPWCAIRPRCSFYRCFVGRNRRVCVGLASQGFFHAFFLSLLDWFCLFLFSVCDDSVWLTSCGCGGGVECGGLITSKTLLEFPTRSWCYAVTQLFLGTSNTLEPCHQLSLGTSNTLLMLRRQLSWPLATVSSPTCNIGCTTPERKKTCDDLEEILGWFGRFI